MSSATIDRARHFVDRVLQAVPPPSMAELAALLDDLARAYHDCPAGDVTDADFDVPRRGAETHRVVRQRFAGFGLYAVADPLVPVNEAPLVADAIDDLGDILNDLFEAIDTYEMLGADDAHWIFRFSYRCHWGAHLRQLAVYLHFKQFYS